jgi:hypothetical protein
MTKELDERTPETPASKTPARGRGVAFARIFTTRREPVTPADIAEALYGRGFVPGVTDAAASCPALAEAGLAGVRFVLGDPGYRFLSMSSARGNGCTVSIAEATVADLPDDYIARRTVPRPRLVYLLDAGGPSNSDRNLCEHIAESLLLITDGLAEIGGLGTKGNRPVLHNSSWLNKIKAQ